MRRGSPAQISGKLAITGVLAAFAALMIISAIQLQAPHLLGAEKTLTDFDAFHVAGDLALRDRAAEAYRAESLQAAYEERRSGAGFMPWTYPPPYTMLMQGLALLPIGFAYLLFIGASLAFYLWTLRRLAGDAYLAITLFAMFPIFMILIRSGQNGFLTGGLIGSFLVAFRQGDAKAGIPLGLMIVKPHLAVGISLMALLGRRWKAMAIAAGLVISALLASSLALGAEIWPAFREGVREAGEFLRAGAYPLPRMTSIYAFARSSGLPANLAFAAQGAGALIALGLLLLVWRRSARPEIRGAAACFASLFVSPYNYDYDLTIFGLALALLMPDLLKRAKILELFGLWLGLWSLSLYGMMAAPSPGEIPASPPLSLAAPGLILLIGALWGILRRPAPENAPQTAPQGLAPALS